MLLIALILFFALILGLTVVCARRPSRQTEPRQPYRCLTVHLPWDEVMPPYASIVPDNRKIPAIWRTGAQARPSGKTEAG